MNIPQFSSLHNLLFYPRLAGTNMKKNKSIYFPYLCAGSLMAGLLYVLNSVGIMVEDSGMEGGDIMYMLVRISFMICILFVFIILFYINSFIIKRRKREFGLFCILGMEKKLRPFLGGPFQHASERIRGNCRRYAFQSGNVPSSSEIRGAARKANLPDPAECGG